jgi:diguanylate cyclase (GGDEF)-like protein
VSQTQKNYLHLFLGAFLYFLTAKLGMSIFSLEPYNISLLWLPFGIGVILVEKYGLKATLFIFVASFLSHFNNESTISTVAIIHRIIPSVADSLAPVLAVFLIRKFVDKKFDHISVLLPLTILGGIVPTLLSGIIIAFNLEFAGNITSSEIPEFIAFIIYSDTLGLLLLYPMYKNYDNRIPNKQERDNIIITLGLGIAIVLLAIKYQYLIFLLYPLLLIAAFKIRIKYLMGLLTFTVVFSIAIIHTYKTYFFSNNSAMDSILMVSSFLVTLIFIIIGISLHNAELEYNKHLARIDNLTKTFNRKAYDEKIEELFYSLERYKKFFSIILLDLDNFKKINDTLGHSTGDKVLIDLSSLVQDTLRNTDYFYRMGGEEFVILLPYTKIKKATQVAEKIRALIQNDLKVTDNRTITVSVGVTQVEPKDTKETLYARVDQLQYLSKNNGKNRVSSVL